MLRRSLLKGLLGGAVAAPVMGPQSVAQAMGLGDAALGAAGLAIEAPATPYPPMSMSIEDAGTRLATLNLRSLLAHDFHRRRQGVWSLDADLACCRSFSLSAKIAMQRDRNYQRELDHERDWLVARIAGLVD